MHVVLTNGFPGTGMSGHYCRHGEDDAASGPTASACYVEPSVAAFDGSGTPKTTSGARCTLSNRDAGSMSTLARAHGITQDSTPKVSSFPHDASLK